MKMKIYLSSSGRIISVNGNYTLEKREVVDLSFYDTNPSHGYIVRGDCDRALTYNLNCSALCQLFQFDKAAIYNRQITEDERLESKYTMCIYVSFSDGANLVKTSFGLIPSFTDGEIITGAIGLQCSPVSIVNGNTEMREPEGIQLPSPSRLSVIFEECRQYTRQFL